MSDAKTSLYFISQKDLFFLPLSAETSSQPDPLHYLPWLLLTAACLLAVVILSFVCICKYMNVDKKVSLPSNLVRLFYVHELRKLVKEVICNWKI